MSTGDTQDNSPPETPGQSDSHIADEQEDRTISVVEAQPPEVLTEIEFTLTNASVAECARLFPPYMTASIKRSQDPCDAQRLVAAVSIAPEDQLRLSITNNKVEHIAREMFGAHIETGGGLRYLYIHDTTRAVPNPSFVLEGCRLTAIRDLLGTRIAQAVCATDMYQGELRAGGGDSTDCVSMTVPRAAQDSAEVCILLPSPEAARLRTKLYT